MLFELDVVAFDYDEYVDEIARVGLPLDRVKYGVVGPPVNLTSRIQALAAGGQVLLSEALAARVTASVRVGAPRSVLVKGVSEPVTLLPLEGIVQATAPAPEPAGEAFAEEAVAAGGTGR